MLIFLSVLLINISQISGAEEEEVLYFEDIQSEQQRAVWEQLPLISQSRTTSAWCEVNSFSPQLMSSLSFSFRRWRRWRRSERWLGDDILTGSCYNRTM